jgi:PHD/YefM family antitoxin component YafN of YafNO toxin-antitoxin module
MKTVNALTMRNKLGEVLDELSSTQEPIFVSKGRKIQAVLVTPEQFRRRFLDFQAEEKRSQLLQAIKDLRANRVGAKKSTKVLRDLRGYGS